MNKNYLYPRGLHYPTGSVTASIPASVSSPDLRLLGYLSLVRASFELFSGSRFSTFFIIIINLNLFHHMPTIVPLTFKYDTLPPFPITNP